MNFQTQQEMHSMNDGAVTCDVANVDGAWTPHVANNKRRQIGQRTMMTSSWSTPGAGRSTPCLPG
jgi:hypothetical protein